jgi:glycosidase
MSRITVRSSLGRFVVGVRRVTLAIWPTSVRTELRIEINVATSLQFLRAFLTVVFVGDVAVADEPLSSHEKVFYHVYVRSFADSDGDGKGDLPGLTGKLDYIKSLGVDGMLLLPIFQNDYHAYGGYATTDYERVEEEYGGDKAWNEFIAAAHERGLLVLLDLSLTHVADTHPWFVAAKKDEKSRERKHFIWAGPPRPSAKGVFGMPAWNPVEDGSSYFALYAPNVPHLNLSNQATADAMMDVGALWLKRGADGFRLDSAPHAVPVDPDRPEVIGKSTEANHAFWRSFMDRMKRVKPSSLAVAEVMELDPHALKRFYSDGIDMAFDYPMYFGLIDALSTGKKKNLAFLTSASVAARPRGASGAIFLNNHDVPAELIPPHGRIADFLGGNVTRMQSAALLLFSLPSTPFVFYGEEIGLRGALPPPRPFEPVDAVKKTWSRNPMQWKSGKGRGFTSAEPWAPLAADEANVAAQDGVFGTILETYRGLIKIRRSTPALTRGSYRELGNDHDAVFSFMRADRGDRILVAVNFSNSEVTARLDLSKLDIDRATVTEHIFGQRLADVSPANSAAYPLILPAYEGRWLRIEQAR